MLRYSDDVCKMSDHSNIHINKICYNYNFINNIKLTPVAASKIRCSAFGYQRKSDTRSVRCRIPGTTDVNVASTYWDISYGVAITGAPPLEEGTSILEDGPDLIDAMLYFIFWSY